MKKIIRSYLKKLSFYIKVKRKLYLEQILKDQIIQELNQNNLI
jgi:hypothetical protein